MRQRLSPITVLVVIGGGMIGVSARALAVLPATGSFDATGVAAVTLGVNLAGSFLLGVVAARLGGRHPRWKAFLGTGVLGGFTTYSAFAVQSVQLTGAAPFVGLLLVVLSILGGALAAGVGLLLGRPRSEPELLA